MSTDFLEREKKRVAVQTELDLCVENVIGDLQRLVETGYDIEELKDLLNYGGAPHWYNNELRHYLTRFVLECAAFKLIEEQKCQESST